MSIKIKTVVPSVFGLAALAVSITAAQAQEESFSFLEEVVVTAQRKEQSVQDVPVSVTPLSEAFLYENDVRSISDLAGTVPGLVTTTDTSYSSAPISIRGVGGPSGGGNLFSDEPVAIYLNDVYLGRYSSPVTELIDVASLQVLRGPQGTLFGRNSTAGAILVTTKKPTDEFEASIDLTAAEYDEYRAQGVISGPLGDKLAGRLALGYSDRAGFADNISSGTNGGALESTTARATLSWDPIEALSLDFIAEFQESDASAFSIAVSDLGQNGGLSTPYTLRPDIDDLLDRNVVENNDINLVETENTTFSLLGEWSFDNVIINFVTAFRGDEFVGQQDSDSTSLTLFNNTGQNEADQFSQELRVSGETGAIQWTFGGFYYRDDASMRFSPNNFNGFFGLGTNAVFAASQEVEASALFADLTLSVSDDLRLIAGGRYSEEEKDFTNSFSLTALTAGPTPTPLGTVSAGQTIVPGLPFNSSEKFTNFSPRFVVEYDAGEDILIYANYSAGFKSGGFNSFELDDAFDPENIDAYELGFKSDLPNGLGRFNVAGFYSEYEDLQLRLPVPTGGVDIENVGEAEILGLETELYIQPMDNLAFTFNATVLDTEITEGVLPAIPTNLSPFLIGTSLALVDEDVSGNSLTRAPEFQAYIQGEYRYPANFGDVNVSLTYKYQDEVFFQETAQDQPSYRADEWSEVDVRVSLESKDEKWNVAVFGQNIFDDRRITQVSPFGGFPLGGVSEPRKWGVQLGLNF